MSNQKPCFVSVIIPCYNHAHFLRDAIESILKQTYPHYEIIVIDDGSTDDTSRLAESYSRVRLVRQANQGLSTARNRGIRESRGEYLVFLDADDRLLPTALEIGVRELTLRPECAFVYGRSQHINFDGIAIPVTYQAAVVQDHFHALLHSNHIWMPAQVMHRRAILTAIGGFNRFISAAADYDLYLRITRCFPVHNHNEIVAQYRQHVNNMSRNYALMLKTTMIALVSQRKFIRRDKRYLKAYRTGKKHWQSYYGEGCVDQFRNDLRNPDRRQQVFNALLTLLHYYPRGVIKHLSKKIKMTVKRVLGLRSLSTLEQRAEE
jgi:glycosyltransferase involved in cell wall biosynthesis